MKILYAIQGTGNGHLSRARDIIPLLKKKADLDLLVSGTQVDVSLPDPVRYRCDGLSFIFGKKGGIDVLETYRKGNLKRLFREVEQVPVQDYDLVLNDFEPVTAWACRLHGKPCIGLSHQAAVMHPAAPKPEKNDRLGKTILRQYAPVSEAYGFHFARYAPGIFTPVIRAQIRYAAASDLGHYTVYLPAYDDARVVRVLSEIRGCRWEVFSKHTKEEFRERNVHVRPVQNEAFVESLLGCTGILCGAGFETPAEALFLKKKLLTIPMKGQYEQQCNAAALARMGVPVIRSLKEKHVPAIRAWVGGDLRVPVDYPDITEEILDRILARHGREEKFEKPAIEKRTFKSFRDKSMHKILSRLAARP